MELTLSDRFSSLNPMKIRTYPAYEVMLLFQRLIQRNSDKVVEEDPKIMRKPAGDDWF